MRFVLVGAIAAVLAACGGPPAEQEFAGEPAKTVMVTEAEKACAEMTSFSTDKMAGKPPEAQALLQREYDNCVKSVASVEAPALRGRSSAP